MSAYYITQNSRGRLFDKLFENRDIWVEKFNIDTIPDLKTFIMKDKSLRDVEFFILDNCDGIFTNDDILMALEMLLKFSPAKPVILSEASEETDKLFAELAGRNIRNTIKYDDKTTADELLLEMKECLSENGKAFVMTAATMLDGMIQAAKEVTQPKIVLPSGRNLTIGVAGVCTRIGTTTQALLVAEYLKFVGLAPCVIDPDKRFLPIVSQLYQVKQDTDGVASVNDRNLSDKIPKSESFDTYVFDLGTLNAEAAQTLENCDVRLLICGAKPWEIPSLAAALKVTGEAVSHLWFSFTEEEDLNELRMQLRGSQLAALPYNPDPWALRSKEFYNRCLYPLLRELV